MLCSAVEWIDNITAFMWNVNSLSQVGGGTQNALSIRTNINSQRKEEAKPQGDKVY